MKLPLFSVAVASGLHLIALWQLSGYESHTDLHGHMDQFKLTKISVHLGQSPTSQASASAITQPNTAMPSLPEEKPSIPRPLIKSEEVKFEEAQPATIEPLMTASTEMPLNKSQLKTMSSAKERLKQDTISKESASLLNQKNNPELNNSEKLTSTASTSVNTAQKESESEQNNQGHGNNAIEDRTNRYIDFVRTEILKRKHYPKQARLRRHQGSITVAFTLTEDGDIENIKLTKRSSSKYLNKSVRKLLRHMDLPKVEPQIKQEFPKQITLTLDFFLDLLNS